jgi:CubicO group peptidase (beta-lactamase class C family)
VTSGGPSEEGWRALHGVLAGYVDRGDLPGCVALVARGGEARVEAVGRKAFGDPDPMERDAIFRIASLSKPIAAAAMVLVERGALRLDQAADGWLPELADRRVLRELGASLDDTVPARRPITLDDLLTFRLGLGSIMAPPDTYPIQTAEAALQLKTLGPPWPPTPHTPEVWMEQFGTLPLMHQPGERWMYNTSDLDRELTALLFTQRAMTSPEPPEIFVDFANGARQAVEG